MRQAKTVTPTLKVGIPERWAYALTEAGFVSPWNTPSLSRLSRATGLHVSTISRIIKGQNTKGPTKDAARRSPALSGYHLAPSAGGSTPLGQSSSPTSRRQSRIS